MAQITVELQGYFLYEETAKIMSKIFIAFLTSPPLIVQNKILFHIQVRIYFICQNKVLCNTKITIHLRTAAVRLLLYRVFRGNSDKVINIPTNGRCF